MNATEGGAQFEQVWKSKESFFIEYFRPQTRFKFFSYTETNNRYDISNNNLVIS